MCFYAWMFALVNHCIRCSSISSTCGDYKQNQCINKYIKAALIVSNGNTKQTKALIRTHYLSFASSLSWEDCQGLEPPTVQVEIGSGPFLARTALDPAQVAGIPLQQRRTGTP